MSKRPPMDEDGYCYRCGGRWVHCRCRKCVVCFRELKRDRLTGCYNYLVCSSLCLRKGLRTKLLYQVGIGYELTGARK